MPRYFFHTADGRTHRDTDGLELRDRNEAKRVALKMLGDLIKDHTDEILRDGHFDLCLTDEKGLGLLEVILVATAAPAGRDKAN